MNTAVRQSSVNGKTTCSLYEFWK